MSGKQFAMKAAATLSAFCSATVLLLASADAQAKTTLINGTVYRVHAGFLEVQSGAKNISPVKVNAATVYWNGRTEKKATAKDLHVGDQVIIEAVEKDGVPLAQKVRFARAGES